MVFFIFHKTSHIFVIHINVLINQALLSIIETGLIMSLPLSKQSKDELRTILGQELGYEKAQMLSDAEIE